MSAWFSLTTTGNSLGMISLRTLLRPKTPLCRLIFGSSQPAHRQTYPQLAVSRVKAREVQAHAQFGAFGGGGEVAEGSIIFGPTVAILF